VSDSEPQPLRFFLADLHLDGDATLRARTLRSFLKQLVARVSEKPVELYLLGDVFEFWDEYHAQVIARYEEDLAALENAYRAGIRFLIADGNRDFLYGRYVRERLGARLLRDGARVPLAPDCSAWVEHGDLICRGDVRYLRYRRRVRSAPVKLLYRLLPWFVARRLVEGVSAKSTADCAHKAPKDFEPDLDFARSRLHSTSAQVLICGHTHKPRDEDLGDGRRLIVLPPWCEVQTGYRADGAELSPFNVTPAGEIATVGTQ
jgi:UDP-2,3-diacylglucosamine hydrolase